VQAVGQELLKLAVLFLLLARARPTAGRSALSGAYLGLAFGCTEAGYQAFMTAAWVWGWHVFGSAVLVWYHVLAGGLLGRALASGRKRLVVTLGLLALVNLLLRYIPVPLMRLTGNDVITYCIIAVIVFVLLLVTMLSFRRISTSGAK
jgi:hypothetical protein